jgi:hypothetical protein
MTIDYLTGWEYVSYKNEGPSPRSGHSAVIVDNFLYMLVFFNMKMSSLEHVSNLESIALVARMVSNF